MNLHTPHHTTSKKTNGLDRTNGLIKAQSDALKHTSPNKTEITILKPCQLNFPTSANGQQIRI